MTRTPLNKRAEVWLLIIAVFGMALGSALTLWNDRTEAAVWIPPAPRTINPDCPLRENVCRIEDENNTISVFEFAKYGVVMVSTEQSIGRSTTVARGNGSGFFIDEVGHIVTNYHVIDGSTSITIHTYSGGSYDATVIGKDRLTDLAVLKISASSEEIWPLTFADMEQVRVGQKAIVLGSPLATGSSLGLDRSPTTTTGIISAKDRSLPVESLTKPGVNDYTIENLIQTDAAVNPGNSGGPLLNSLGEVVGVVTAIIDSANGIGFAIPSDVVQEVIPDIMAKGEVKRAYMGIQYQSLDVWAKTLGSGFPSLGLPTGEGALLVSIEPDGPAAKAGLRGGSKTVTIGGQEIVVGGDIIVGISGVRIYGSNLQGEILKHKPGERIEVEYYRGSEKRSVAIVLGSR